MEHGNDFLIQASIYFGAAVLAVMVAYRLGLGSVAGYLIAGIAIGPWGFKLIDNVNDVRAHDMRHLFDLRDIGVETIARTLSEDGTRTYR